MTGSSMRAPVCSLVLVPPAGARRTRDSRHRVGRIIIAAAAALVLAGCGGASKPYTLAATKACLTKNATLSIPPDQSADLIADQAPGGKIVVDFPGASKNSATIAFGRSSGDAKRMRAAYKLFADAMNTPIADIFFLDRNVAYAFENTPTDAEKTAVKDCLKG